MMEDYLRFRDQFAEAMDARYYPIEWLDKQVFSGRVRCWAGKTAAITAEIRVYPTGAKAVHGLYAAGELLEILTLIPLAEQWGRDNGCTSAFIDSREAWQRLLNPYGYAAYKVCVRKEI
jgi:hypothetical protein